MSKQLTPIQEAVKFIKETYPITLKRNGEVRVIMEHLISLLPAEKKFAKDIWDAGVNFSLEQMDSAVKRHKEPDFETFYKQFEP